MSHNEQGESIKALSWFPIENHEDCSQIIKECWAGILNDCSQKENILYTIPPWLIPSQISSILSTSYFFHWKYEVVVLLPAKLLISFVLHFGKKKSCFLSFVSWLQPLVPPTSWFHGVYFRLRLPNKPIDHFSLPWLLVSHRDLSEWKVTSLPLWDFFFFLSWITLVFS